MKLLPRSIRARISLVAAAGATAAAILGTFAFAAIAVGELADRIRDDVALAVDQVAVALIRGTPVEDVPLPPRADGTQIRIVDPATAEVLAASPAVVVFERMEGEGQRSVELGLRAGPEVFPATSPLRATVAVTTPGGRDLQVEGARDEASLGATRGAILQAAVVAGPIGVAVTAALAWVLAGRALHPVQAMTRQAATIDDGRRAERIPVPDSDDEVAELATVLNGMLERFERARAREEALVSDVAHELRTPLAALRARIEARLTDGPDPSLAAALEQVERLAALVQGLLDVARLQGGPAPIREQRPVDLRELVDAAVADVTGAAVHVAGRAPPVPGDPTLLVRVVGNLVDNAVRHGAGRVDVRLDAVDGDARLIVDDDGPGIPAGQRERVFDRFVRLDASRDHRTGGTGLGLAIVRAAVEAHGGAVGVDDAPLGGARLVVRLPAA